VEFVDPDAPQAAHTPSEIRAGSLSLIGVLQAPTGDDAERQFLLEEVSALSARVESNTWVDKKQELLGAMNDAGFWQAPERYRVLDRIERMDRIEAASAAARSLALRIEHRKESQQAAPRQIVCSLAEQLHLVKAALLDLEQDRASDAYLCVERVAADVRHSPSPDWPSMLARMYREWARKRRMRVTVLADGHDAAFVMAVGGLGPSCILAPEAGLHVLEIPDENGGFERHTARVRVVPQSLKPPPPDRAELQNALDQLNTEVDVPNTIVRRYRERPSPLVRDSRTGTRTGRLAQILGGDFDLIG
jgi:ATP-dependent Clp protease ATP-binding subunit ClpC